MDAQVGMPSPEEHRISIANNSSRCSEKVCTVIDEDASSLPIKSDEDEEWIREVEKKIDGAFIVTHWPLLPEDETEAKISKFTLREEISRPRSVTVEEFSQPRSVTVEEFSQPRSVTVEEFSQPRVVTIGPFHWTNKTSICNKKKWIILYFMNYLYSLDLRSCLAMIKDQVADARKCYSALEIPTILSFQEDKNDRRFAEMLLLDSYFILFMLTIQIRKRPTGYTLISKIRNSTEPLNLFRDDKSKVLDIIFNKDEIALDLLILDNQIPFFVIEEQLKKLDMEKPLHEYALEFFETIHPTSTQGRRKGQNNNSPPECLHLLHLFHWSRVSENRYIKLTSPSPEQLDSNDWARRTPNAMELTESATANWERRTPNAMELTESATMFEKKKFGSSLDITFRRRRFKRIIKVLEIPELHIRDYSGFIFHNLIAFEMQSSNRGRCTMAFSVFMRNMLQGKEDAKLLRRRGILASSSMTDIELIHLFKCLSKLTENHRMPTDLCTICHDVMSYHNNRVSRFCGDVNLRYFPNPVVKFSVIFSVIVAVVLFVLTLLQTIYAMK